MMRVLILTLAAAALTGCTDPQFATGVTVGSGGVAVSNSLSGSFGNATVSVSN